MKIRGIMKHVPLLGGFWGIEAENGQRLRPVKPLHAAFHQNGLAIEAEVQPRQGFSIFMWGTDVDVLTIRKIEVTT